MKNSDYWKKRFEQLEQSQNQKGIECFADIEKQYRKAQRQIEAQIRSWYQRFADNNQISLADARRMLTNKELEELKWDVHEYIRYGEENAINGTWMKQLENASARYHISRLEEIQLQMQQSLEVMFGNQLDSIDSTMRDIYRSGYYQTAFEVQKGVGVGWDFTTLDEKRISKVINKPWAVDGKNFSERVWGNRQKLVNELNNELTKNIILGQDPQKAIDVIAKKMNTSKNAAGRLVMTEEAFFSSASQKDCFDELDVEQFEIVATLDSHTSEICRGMDGKHFPMSQWQVGVTAPPFHVYCRSTTVPYFDDDFDAVGERAARGEDGKTYYIPADMTYRQWEKSFVDGDKEGLQEITLDDKIKVNKPVLQKDQMTKLHSVMPDDDFEQYFKLLSNNTTSNIGGLYAQFADKCGKYTLTTNTGAYSPANDTVQFHFESDRNVKDGMNRYNVLGHECGHMFDKHIGRNLNANFTELDAVNAIGSKKFSSIKMLKETPSNSDEFLSALRKDAETMRQKMKSEAWGDIRADMLSSSASSGVQDFLDGFFSTQSSRGQYYLPWGHGERYYNRKYNSWIKSFGLEKDLKQLYLDLGFDASNQSKVKTLYRIYETASEAWANCASAETVGGKELEFIKKYMPETYEAFIRLIGGVIND